MSQSVVGSTWIVVPAFNEQDRLPQTLSTLCRTGQHQVVVVDDGSSDATAVVARRFPVWVLRHPVNCGQGASLRTGIEFALARGADRIVTFDADGQHDPAEIPRLLEPIERGEADVVLGSRFLGTAEGIPPVRRLLLKAAVAFTRLTSGLRVTDSHNGFRALSRRAAETIRIEQPRMAHASEIFSQIAEHRLRFREVPVTIRYTSETLGKGQSTMDAFRIGGQLIIGRAAR